MFSPGYIHLHQCLSFAWLSSMKLDSKKQEFTTATLINLPRMYHFVLYSLLDSLICNHRTDSQLFILSPSISSTFVLDYYLGGIAISILRSFFHLKTNVYLNNLLLSSKNAYKIRVPLVPCITKASFFSILIANNKNPHWKIKQNGISVLHQALQ